MNASESHQYGISADYLDYILKNQLRTLQPHRIVDFGAGQGKNGTIVREVIGTACELIAVEGCENTAHYLQTTALYTTVASQLIQEWLRQNNEHYDMALFGDVLEHLSPAGIHRTLRQCLSIFKTIIIVVPLHNIFQGAAYGNVLEEHRTYVTKDFFKGYKILEQHIYRGPKAVMMNVLITAGPLTGVKDTTLAFKLFHVMMVVLQPLGLAKPLVTLLKKFGTRYKSILFGK